MRLHEILEIDFTRPQVGDAFDLEFDEDLALETAIARIQGDNILLNIDESGWDLIEKYISEGATKDAMHDDAERMELKDFLNKWAQALGDEEWMTEFWKNINESVSENSNQVPQEIYNLLDELTADDTGSEEFGEYVLRFEGFTDWCQQDAADRCDLPDNDPRKLKYYEDVYDEVLQGWIKEQGAQPVDKGFAGSEDYPVQWAVFKKSGVAEGLPKAQDGRYNPDGSKKKQWHQDPRWQQFDKDQEKDPKNIYGGVGKKKVKEPGVAEDLRNPRDNPCWKGYKPVGTKQKNGRTVPNCVPESITEELNIGDPVIITGNVQYQGKTGDIAEFGRDKKFVVVNLYNYGKHSFHSSDVEYNDYADEEEIDEAVYKGRRVSLGKPTSGDIKKYKVYVKNPRTGKVVKVNFGDPHMRIKRNIPGRRKSFRARHHCSTAKDRTTARYWSCRFWSKRPVSSIMRGR